MSILVAVLVIASSVGAQAPQGPRPQWKEPHPEIAYLPKPPSNGSPGGALYAMRFAVRIMTTLPAQLDGQ